MIVLSVHGNRLWIIAKDPIQNQTRCIIFYKILRAQNEKEVLAIPMKCIVAD